LSYIRLHELYKYKRKKNMYRRRNVVAKRVGVSLLQ
jgi:hypothetical protein